VVKDDYGNGGVQDTRPENSICDSLRLEVLPVSANVGVLRLTHEEALGLLDLALLAPSELTSPQHTALEKLGRLCREFVCMNSQSD
jgi:hypothetical protein